MMRVTWLLVAILFIVLVQAKQADPIEKFNQWVEKCLQDDPDAPFKKPRIEIRDTYGMGLGTFATRDIAAESVYMHLPYKCIMTDDKARAALGADKITGLDDFHVLLLYLLSEKAKGASSFFKPYFDVMPKSFDIPYFWRDSELNMLSNSEIVQAVHSERNQIRQQYNMLKQQTLDKHFKGPAYSFAWYEWAKFAMNSRTIWVVGDNNKRSLVPLLDHVNCKEFPNPNRLHQTHHDFSTNAAVTKAPWDFKKGEQVFENYGSDNYNNFYYHGFTLMDNSHDCVQMRYEGSTTCVSVKKMPQNRSNLARAIRDKLALYKTTMQQDESIYNSYVASHRMKAAHIFLHEEKRVLQQVLRAL